MKGKDLYKYLVSKRDYSGSEADEYAQFLTTLFSQLGDSFFALLETAHSKDKKLSIKNSDTSSDVLVDEYTLENIIIL